MTDDQATPSDDAETLRATYDKRWRDWHNADFANYCRDKDGTSFTVEELGILHLPTPAPPSATIRQRLWLRQVQHRLREAANLVDGME